MALLMATILATSPIAVGKATRYDPGLMQQVVQNRIKWGQLNPNQGGRYLGYVAVYDCALIGESVVLELPGGVYSGPHLVADCGAVHDQEYLDSIDFAVDLSYPLAQRLGAIDAPIEGVKVWLISLRNRPAKGAM